jgi:SAM-dependent methyltransferase
MSILTRPWDIFFEDKVRTILTHKTSAIDIGGSLRVAKDKNNRYDPSHEWMRPLIEKINYRVLDPVPDYHPDIVGDIHHLPFADNSQDAILCLAVLEHIEDPIQASKELLRTLKPGGYCLVYVPFLYYYHAERGYYGDFWRYTPDSLKYLFKGFKTFELAPVRGAVETLVRLSPLGRWRMFGHLGYLLDRVTGKLHSSQVSGYYLFLIK